MWQSYDLIGKEITMLKKMTSEGLLSHKNELWRKIDSYFTGYRKELMAD